MTELGQCGHGMQVAALSEQDACRQWGRWSGEIKYSVFDGKRDALERSDNIMLPNQM